MSLSKWKPEITQTNLVKPWKLEFFKVSKRTLQVIRSIFQNLNRISSWTLKKSSRNFKIHQIFLGDFWVQWKKLKKNRLEPQPNLNLTESLNFSQKLQKIQKLIFQNLLRIGQNFKHNSCRSCSNMQSFFLAKT